MIMKKNFFYQVALSMAVAVPFFTSCSGNDDPADETLIASEYIYVLNSGNMNSNDASLSRYDVKENTVTKDVFEAQNGRRLGDTGQDMVLYGGKIYITMTGERTIEVTDLEAKSIRQIRTESGPRSLAVYEGKVYVTYQNGYVARIDTTTLEVEAKVQVGRNPEQLTVTNGKLYVANSGGLDYNTEVGYDKTVSVVDIASFTEIKKIEVAVNPSEVESDQSGNVYVISKGNYGDIPNTLQKINPATDAVSVLEGINGVIFTMAGNTLYAIYSQWGVADIYYYAYDAVNNRVLSDHFIGDTELSAKPDQLNYEATYEHLFIMTSDYIVDGDVYIFDKDRKFVRKFEAGLNPMKAVYVKK
jgi:YVTN family beta-propeller protein